MMQCPSCARPCEPRLTCSGCGAPLGVELDCFAALNLPRKLVIDPQSLEAIYHEAGRRIHPDRFAAAAPAVRQASLRSTALLTRGYRTLRDPVSRGRYWLELQGRKLSENNKQVAPATAELVFDIQERLSELREAQDAGRDALAAALRERRAELATLIRRAHDELGRNFSRWDENQGEREELIGELKATLSTIAYLNTLVRDVDRALESGSAD